MAVAGKDLSNRKPEDRFAIQGKGCNERLLPLNMTMIAETAAIFEFAVVSFALRLLDRGTIGGNDDNWTNKIKTNLDLYLPASGSDAFYCLPGEKS